VTMAKRKNESPRCPDDERTDQRGQPLTAVPSKSEEPEGFVLALVAGRLVRQISKLDRRDKKLDDNRKSSKHRKLSLPGRACREDAAPAS
jgi:hypothetical protein